MNDHTIQYKLDNTINPSPLKKFNTRSNIGALGLKFRERVTFGPQRGERGVQGKIAGGPPNFEFYCIFM